MAYAQTAFYYALKTAGAMAMFCVIIMGSKSVLGEIARIIIAGAIVTAIAPFALKYALTAAAIVVAWRMAKALRRSVGRAGRLACDAVRQNPRVIRARARKRYDRLERQRRKRDMERYEREATEAGWIGCEATGRRIYRHIALTGDATVESVPWKAEDRTMSG